MVLEFNLQFWRVLKRGRELRSRKQNKTKQENNTHYVIWKFWHYGFSIKNLLFIFLSWESYQDNKIIGISIQLLHTHSNRILKSFPLVTEIWDKQMYSLDIYFKIFQYFERAIRSKWWMRYPFCSSSWYFHEFFSLHWKEEDHVKMQIKYILLWRTYNLNTYLLLVQSMHQTRICFSSSWPYTPFHIAVWLTAAQQSTWTPACPQLPTAWYM